MKKFLLSLFVGFVGIISFCSAEKITYMNIVGDGNYSVNYTLPSLNDYYYVISGANCSSSNCFSFQCGYSSCKFEGFNSNFLNQGISNIYNSLLYSTSSCWDHCDFKIYGSSSAELFIIDKTLNFPCPTCPEINTGEILSGYILESEIDTNYCVGNGLCPNECGSGTDLSGDLQYSNLYINSILHPGEENIFIDIPDYIQWDYSVTTGEFNIYVGSGYDMDYMNSIIKINSYRPDSTDFTDVFVSGLTLIFPYIFVVLLLMFIWKLLKRIFK